MRLELFGKSLGFARYQFHVNVWSVWGQSGSRSDTVKNGMRYPLSSMPGESVNHAFSGPMHNETIHFLEAIALNKPVLVKPEEARLVMDLYIAADISAETGEPVTLPRNDRG